MTPYWSALASHAYTFSSSWIGKDVGAIQEHAVTNLASHQQDMSELPATLIHNDFNPRNIALRSVDGKLRLCAYDWETAKVGLPRHDLAESLCFVLTRDISKAEVFALLELHRVALSHAVGVSIDKDGWLLGFRLSLLDLLINRFAMYTVTAFAPAFRLNH